MNHIYRVVYNAATNTYQAVPENSTGKHKTASEKSSCAVSDVSEKGAFFALKPMALCAMAMGLSSTGAWAAPTGGHISAGDASIAQHGKITNIQQNSQKAAINWQTFGIKADETVNFKQPNAQAVILNRVIGNEKSVIDGAMNANGKVFISNPNGMIIGKNAQINVGALLATTAKIKNQDFMNGLFKFDQATGDITQLGDIKVPTGGVVALIAPIVANKGNITAPQGKVLLASAEQFSITLPDNGQFAYTLDRGTLQGLVDNGGAILADGGHVILTAKGTDAVKKSLIKHTGKIEANTVQNKNGVIELLGDLDNTRLEASGSLKAEAKEKGDGGFIETSAAKVSIRDLSVSTKSKFGKTGEWLIDPQDFNINAGSGEHTETSIGADTLSQNLQSTDITISTDSNGSEKGDIYVNAPVSWDNNRLTLSAHNNIYINENLNGSGNARLELKYGQASENAIQADGTESDYYIQKGKKIDLPTGQNLVVQRGSSSDNARRLTVLHSLPNDGRLFPKYVALGTDLNLSGQPFTQGLNGVELFHGLGHEIDGLEIDHTQNMSGQSPEHIGFIPNLSGGIRDLTLNNVNIKAQINDDCDGNCNEPIGVGALIGRAGDATIKNIYVSGKMSDLGNYGNVKMGGLIGIADGRVRVINSHADVNIEKQEQTQANELVGLDNGGLSVENSQGTGNITNIEPTQPVNPPAPTTPPASTQPVNPTPPVTQPVIPTQPAPTTPPAPTQPANPTPPVTQPLQPVPTPQPTTQPVIPAQPVPTTPQTPQNTPTTGQNTSQNKPTLNQDKPKPTPTNHGNQLSENNNLAGILSQNYIQELKGITDIAKNTFNNMTKNISNEIMRTIRPYEYKEKENGYVIRYNHKEYKSELGTYILTPSIAFEKTDDPNLLPKQIIVLDRKFIPFNNENPLIDIAKGYQQSKKDFFKNLNIVHSYNKEISNFNEYIKSEQEWDRKQENLDNTALVADGISLAAAGTTVVSGGTSTTITGTAAVWGYGTSLVADSNNTGISTGRAINNAWNGNWDAAGMHAASVVANAVGGVLPFVSGSEVRRFLNIGGDSAKRAAREAAEKAAREAAEKAAREAAEKAARETAEKVGKETAEAYTPITRENIYNTDNTLLSPFDGKPSNWDDKTGLNKPQNDHILPQKYIKDNIFTKYPNLLPKQHKMLLNFKGNIEKLPATFNASKKDKVFGGWTHHKNKPLSKRYMDILNLKQNHSEKLLNNVAGTMDKLNNLLKDIK